MSNEDFAGNVLRNWPVIVFYYERDFSIEKDVFEFENIRRLIERNVSRNNRSTSTVDNDHKRMTINVEELYSSMNIVDKMVPSLSTVFSNSDSYVMKINQENEIVEVVVVRSTIRLLLVLFLLLDATGLVDVGKKSGCKRAKKNEQQSTIFA